ncbi:MAG: ethanolamine operon regulator [Rhodovulum sulfidophilum]|uniref:Ethanolamine operon regulator n=1 Tax=Rhodovulum sulfidophilum TaxID=35806 RepID=A0A2W5MYH5_RHOSU|nr:MAG: ethanolamine operon regulator [Rhodovulum sulfidophilum]
MAPDILPDSPWRVVPVRWIEDLRDAVRGAGLRATQMSRGSLSSGLAFAEEDGVLYTSGRLGARVAMSGPLSLDKVTIGIGLRLPSGTWHWHREVTSGNLGLFLPGDEHHSLYMPDSLYVSATMDPGRLEAEAAWEDRVLDHPRVSGSGVHPRMAPAGITAAIAHTFDLLHEPGAPVRPEDLAQALRLMRRMAAVFYGREPRVVSTAAKQGAHARIFSQARRYIEEHLDAPIPVEALAAAASTSRRSLHRAFLSMVGETPQAYVRRLRLHRFRYDLAAEAEASCTVTMAATRWGMGEFGRIAGRYRELFGELPSETLARRRRRILAQTA